MVDILSPRERSLHMSRIRAKDTMPERIVRSFLHARGFRFRLHQRGLAGRPDLFLRKHRAVIFVHGCFWHMHPGCSDATLPGGTLRKREFWRSKLHANRRRDRNAVRSLLSSGLRVAVVWECTTRHPEKHPRALERLVRWIRGTRRYLELP